MSFRTLSYRLTALCLAVAMLHLTALPSRAATVAERMRLTGELTVLGLAKVDGELAVSGQTLFSESKIETTRDAISIVNLGARGRFWLLEDSSIRLSFDASTIRCLLGAGKARFSVPEGIRASVETEDASVISDDAQPAVFSVGFWNEELIVAVVKGRVELRTEERTRQLSAGQFAFVEDSAQTQAGGKKKKWSGRKLAAILLPIGGALAVLAFVFTRGDSNTPTSFGGCVIAPSGMTDVPCP
jgi:ferric-dicitrate binding protein FerR (iron transport regulator)